MVGIMKEVKKVFDPRGILNQAKSLTRIEG